MLRRSDTQSLIIYLDDTFRLKWSYLAELLAICASPKGPEILRNEENSQ
jgi:hypothetical protein